MESVQESDMIIVRLTSDEALVLDSLLARFDSREFSGPADALVIQHPAERAALWALQAALEKVLVGR